MFTHRFVQMQDPTPILQETELVVEKQASRGDQKCMPFFQLLDKFCIIRAEQVDSFASLQTDGFFDVRL